jgi:hypothetical protein
MVRHSSVSSRSASCTCHAGLGLELPPHEHHGIWERINLALIAEHRKKRRQSTPSYVNIDSQKCENELRCEQRGFHGGIIIKGGGRQVAVDTEGNLLCVHVHSANKADTVEACVLMKLAPRNRPRFKAVCADAGYRGTFEVFMKEEFGLPVHISEKIKDGLQ